MQTAGGGAGGDIAMPVKRDHAHGAVHVSCPATHRLAGGLAVRVAIGGRGRHAGGARRNGLAFLAKLPHERLPARLGEEVAGRLLFEAGLQREGVGAFANEEDVRRLFHHRARQADGMPRARDVGHGAGFERGAIHDGCVHLVAAVGGEDGSLAGVEERIVFENVDCRLDRIERRATPVEHFGACFNSLRERGDIPALPAG